MARIRHDIATLTLGQDADAETQPWHPVLDTYARGVELMRALPMDNPQSWLWAANTHGIPVGTPARPAWGQCAHASLFFLPWHRAYLAWFEGTIRELTADNGWGLPYWDYSNGDNPDAALLPVEFRVPNRTVDGELVPNPLFDPTRNEGPLPGEDIDLVPALSEPRFVRSVPDVGFGGTDRDRRFGDVESTPHNWVQWTSRGSWRAPRGRARIRSSGSTTPTSTGCGRCGSPSGLSSAGGPRHDELFDELMPLQSPDGRDRHALVSTHDGDWDSVPDTDGTLSLYSSRCTLHDTRTVALGGSLEIRFPGPVPNRSRPSA